MNKIRSHLHIYFKDFLNQLNFFLYLHMFIFTTDKELWSHELMRCIMSRDHSLDRMDTLKFILLFHDPI
jgi:hypothetical protein